MQESPNNDISFLDMELKHQANDGPSAQGTDYTPFGLRQYDEVELPTMQAEHERARQEGSKG